MENHQKKSIPCKRCMICRDSYELKEGGKKHLPVCNACFDKFAGIWLMLAGGALSIFSLLLTLNLGSLIWLLLYIPGVTGFALGLTILLNYE